MSRFVATTAKRENVKARIGLTGATNTGKTWTALLIAEGLLKAENYVLEDGSVDWSKIYLIDTERKRALFYADNGVFGQFKHIEFTPPYDPNSYIEAVKYAESQGAKVMIIDSISHAWSGAGGVLDIVNERTLASKSKNSFNEGWGGKEGGSALQNKLIDEILSSNCHIIATFRQKMEYVQERNEEGKVRITKLGVKPIQKDDLEYEFDITLKLNNDHTAEVIKNTVNFISEKEFESSPITSEFGENLGKYLSSGIDPAQIQKEKRDTLIENIKELGKESPSLITFFKTAHSDWNINDLTINQCYEVLKEFKEIMGK